MIYKFNHCTLRLFLVGLERLIHRIRQIYDYCTVKNTLFPRRKYPKPFKQKQLVTAGSTMNVKFFSVSKVEGCLIFHHFNYKMFKYWLSFK